MDWVQGEGGEIHDALRLSDERQPYVASNLEEGTQLLKIPASCLVSRKTIESTEYGRNIVEVVDSVDAGQLYSPVHDVTIALYLARYPSTNDDDTTTFQPYLDTLPEGSSYDDLPRRWTEEQLRTLSGSPLLGRIQKQRKGIETEFDSIKRHWKDRGHKEAEFPSFQAFSDRLAAVTSRAFAGFGCAAGGEDDLNSAMVPILDLCDHRRGKNQTKNLSYIQSAEDGSVLVAANQDIQEGETLCITYGAQSNSQLLLNYGFCIDSNIEPDNSSNDFLEFEANGEVVELRAGPKSHSSLGFVKALDACNQPRETIEKDPSDDFDDFEQNEKDFDEWDVDMMANMDEHEEDEDEDGEEEMKNEQEKRIKLCLEALASFEKRLSEMREGYHLKEVELKSALAQVSFTPKRQSAILVKSELRTIYFVLCVIRRLKEILKDGDAKTAAVVDEFLSDADVKVLVGQAQEVSTAFLAIRFPDLNIKQS